MTYLPGSELRTSQGELILTREQGCWRDDEGGEFTDSMVDWCLRKKMGVIHAPKPSNVFTAEVRDLEGDSARLVFDTQPLREGEEVTVVRGDVVHNMVHETEVWGDAGRLDIRGLEPNKTYRVLVIEEGRAL